jgi:non-specific serine/threonine protein kinase/serine/threonine-protein kinase
MTREEWQRVKEILHDALELPRAGRTEFLDRSCNGNTELRDEVESLLRSHDDAGSFIESSPAAAAPAVAREEFGVGAQLGPYRIVQLIAEGGMGSVYQAVRVDDLYRKVVAIKVVRRGAFGEYALRQFDTERQILAHLDHPNIAKLLDGGATPDGRPYFVMDFIAGTPLDEYCDSHKLNLTERIQFFMTVCSAVHYAHQNLVIHRDLKPQNIMVTEEGSVKLLDFGIAKLLDPDALSPGPTLTTLQAMTPEFASPEQLSGGLITTASDVYSLGVLLYRLLTGHRPYALETRSIDELWDHVRNRPPRRPSTVIRVRDEDVTPEAICAARSTRPDRLERQLGGDLDNILLMALRKEPERRYNSVEQFAGDLRRHLASQPVTARPDTLRYRTGKFIQRNRTAVVAAFLVAITLLGGIVATSWQAHTANVQRARAERRFQEVRGLARTVLFELHDAIVNLPGSTQAREILVKRAQQYLDGLAVESKDDSSLQRERAMAYMRIGDVLGLPTRPNLGHTAEALDSYRKALEIEKELAVRDPANTTYPADLAATYNSICQVQQSSGKFRESLNACLEAERIQESRASARPGDLTLRADLAATHQNIAGAYFNLGEWEHSREQRSRALAEFQELHRRDPQNEVFLSELATAYHRMAGLEEQVKNYSVARTNSLHAVALFSEIADRHPGDIRKRSGWTFAQQRLGSILISLQDLPGALDAFEKVLPIREQLRALDVHDVRAQVNLSNSHAAIGVVLLDMGRAVQARSHFEDQRKVAEALAEQDPVRIEHQYSLSEAYENLGRVAMRLKQRDRAQAQLNQALKIYQDLETRGAISAEYADVPARIRKELNEALGR